jgi:peptidoglycan/LPS O-acetylase OafA/YrhL
VAVAAVVVFHFSREWLPGGYLGVDAFFVLSGFLITRLLLRDAVGGRVGLGHFWSRRARRLLPALFLYLAAVIVFVVVSAEASQLEQMRREILATVFYVANWEQVVSGVSYFAPFAEPSPLRHTWSLAIEEQFYLVWPLVVAGLAMFVRRRRAKVSFRHGPDRVVTSVFVVALVGATASAVWAYVLWAGGADESRLYFGTDTRLTAVLLGAALAAALHRWPLDEVAPRTLSLTGVVAFVGILVVWAVDIPNPQRVAGGLALHAEAVALVAVAAMVEGPVRRVLSVGPLVWLGRISYGVYLWHLLVQNVIDTDLVGNEVLLFTTRVVVTLVVAAASFYLVEQPVREGRAFSLPIGQVRPQLAMVAALIPLIVVTVWVTANAEPSFADRYEADLLARAVPPSVPLVAASAGPLASAADPTSTTEPTAPGSTVPVGPLEVVVIGDDVVSRLAPRPTLLSVDSADVRVTGLPGSFCPHTVVDAETAEVAVVPECDGWNGTESDLDAIAEADVVVVATAQVPDLSDQEDDPFGYVTRIDMAAVESAFVELDLQVPDGMPTVVAIPGSDDAAPRSALARYGSIVRRLATSEGRTLADVDELLSPRDVAELAAEQITAIASAQRDVTEVMLLGDSVAWSLGYGWYGDPTQGFTPSADDLVLVWNRGSEFCELVQLPRRAQGEVFEAESRCADWREVWPEPLSRYSPDVIAVHVGVWEVFDREVGGRWVEVGTPEHDELVIDALEDVVELLATPDRPVAFVTVPPGERDGEFSPPQWTLEGRAALDHFNELLTGIAERFSDRVSVVDLSGWLCPDDCVAQVDGQPIRDDGLHYDPAGAVPVSAWLSEQLREVDEAF